MIYHLISQEERWHEANIFPSAPSHKADIVLSLGKRRPRQLQHLPTSMPKIGTSSTIDICITKGGIEALARGARSFTSNSRSRLAMLRAEGSWNPFVSRHSKVLERHAQGVRGEVLGGVKSPNASDDEGWGEEMMDDDEHLMKENLEEEEDDDPGFHRTVKLGGVVPGLLEHADEKGKHADGEEAAKRSSVRMKDKLTARLAKWPPFRTPKVCFGRHSSGY